MVKIHHSPFGTSLTAASAALATVPVPTADRSFLYAYVLRKFDEACPRCLLAGLVVTRRKSSQPLNKESLIDLSAKLEYPGWPNFTTIFSAGCPPNQSITRLQKRKQSHNKG